MNRRDFLTSSTKALAFGVALSAGLTGIQAESLGKSIVDSVEVSWQPKYWAYLVTARADINGEEWMAGEYAEEEYLDQSTQICINAIREKAGLPNV